MIWKTFGGVLLVSGLLSVYAYASFILPGEAEITHHGEAIYDMDIPRVTRAVASRLEAPRALVHPLLKIFLAPIGTELASALPPDLGAIGAAKILIGLSVVVYSLLVGVLARQLTRGARYSGPVAVVLCGGSYSSLLAACLPESAAFSGLSAVVPLVFLNRRIGREFTRGEAVAWGLVAVFGLAFTITQLVHTVIALGVRVLLLRRAGAEQWRAMRARIAAGVVVSLALCTTLSVAAASAQARLYRGTPVFYRNLAGLVNERIYVHGERFEASPLGHVANVAGHFALYPFVSPSPAYSDFFIKKYGLRFWSLSIEDTGLEHWSAAQLALGACVLALVAASVWWGLAHRDVLWLAPTLSVASQFGLHLFYGREYIMYAPNWHGVVVALVLAGLWSGPRRVVRLLPPGLALLSAGLLWSNLAVLSTVYREVAVGFSVSDRDSGGRPLPHRAVPERRRPIVLGPRRPSAAR